MKDFFFVFNDLLIYVCVWISVCNLLDVVLSFIWVCLCKNLYNCDVGDFIVIFRFVIVFLSNFFFLLCLSCIIYIVFFFVEIIWDFEVLGGFMYRFVMVCMLLYCSKL